MVVAWPRARPLRQGLPRAAPWPGHAPYDAGSARDPGPALIDESIDAEGRPDRATCCRWSRWLVTRSRPRQLDDFRTEGSSWCP